MDDSCIFVALWPDEKISIMQSSDLHSLYSELETIGSADECRIKKLNRSEKLCLTFKPVNTVKKYGCNIEDYCGDFPNTQLETMERYEELLKSGDMSDVTVHAGPLQFKCHQLILSVQCPYFASMFRSDCLEKNKGEVHIQSIPPQIVKSIIKYLYTGKVDASKETIESHYKEEAEKRETPSVTGSIVKARRQEVSANSSDMKVSSPCANDPSSNGRHFNAYEVSKTNRGSPSCKEKFSWPCASIDHCNINQGHHDKSAHSEKIDDTCNISETNKGSSSSSQESKSSNVQASGETSSLCNDVAQSQVAYTKMGHLYWQDMYLAADYLGLPSLQEFCKVHLYVLCYQLKGMIKDHQFCNCSENETILELILLLYQLGSEIPGLSKLHSLTCKLVRDFTMLDKRNVIQIQKAEYVCKVIPNEMKNKVLSANDPKTFLSRKHVELAQAIENTLRFPDVSVLHKWSERLKNDEDCIAYLEDINVLHLAIQFYECYKRSNHSKENYKMFFEELLSIFLSGGIDVNKVNHLGNTPLHIAALHWDVEAIKTLVASGADVLAMNKANRVPLEEVWHQFDQFAGIVINTEESETFDFLSATDRDVLKNKSKEYQEIASHLMQKMVLTNDRRNRKGPDKDKESACRELVSSEFIDECLRGGLPREFELVQNGGLLSHNFLNSLTEALYPNVSQAAESLMSEPAHSFGPEGNSERKRDIEDTRKEVFAEAGLKDLKFRHGLPLSSLATRTKINCQTCPRYSCGRCTAILSSSDDSAIPQDVLNLHKNIKVFCSHELDSTESSCTE